MLCCDLNCQLGSRVSFVRYRPPSYLRACLRILCRLTALSQRSALPTAGKIKCAIWITSFGSFVSWVCCWHLNCLLPLDLVSCHPLFFIHFKSTLSMAVGRQEPIRKRSSAILSPLDMYMLKVRVSSQRKNKGAVEFAPGTPRPGELRTDR